jgi:hypothetical protein
MELLLQSVWLLVWVWWGGIGLKCHFPAPLLTTTTTTLFFATSLVEGCLQLLLDLTFCTEAVVLLVQLFSLVFRECLSRWWCKNVSDIQVLLFTFFATSPIKLKLGLQIGGETTKSKPPGLIIMMIGQSEIGSTGQTLICRCAAGLLWHLPSSAKLDAKVLGQNHWAKPAHFDFIFIQF